MGLVFAVTQLVKTISLNSARNPIFFSILHVYTLPGCLSSFFLACLYCVAHMRFTRCSRRQSHSKAAATRSMEELWHRQHCLALVSKGDGGTAVRRVLLYICQQEQLQNGSSWSTALYLSARAMAVRNKLS